MKVVFKGIQNDRESEERLQEYSIRVVSNNSNGEHANIGLTVYLQRFSWPFLEKYYLPCIGLVILTSVSFFVPPKMVPGRGGMLVTLFLVLNNIFSASKVILCILKLIKYFKLIHFLIKDETPISKRTTALTTYILGCQVFAFLAMMYYGFILFAIRKTKKVSNQIQKREPSDNEDSFSRLDKLMFVIYILSFFFYNIVHFSKFIDKMM